MIRIDFDGCSSERRFEVIAHHLYRGVVPKKNKNKEEMYSFTQPSSGLDINFPNTIMQQLGQRKVSGIIRFLANEYY